MTENQNPLIKKLKQLIENTPFINKPVPDTIDGSFTLETNPTITSTIIEMLQNKIPLNTISQTIQAGAQKLEDIQHYRKNTTIAKIWQSVVAKMCEE
jgi:hypothetical protein